MTEYLNSIKEEIEQKDAPEQKTHKEKQQDIDEQNKQEADRIKSNLAKAATAANFRQDLDAARQFKQEDEASFRKDAAASNEKDVAASFEKDTKAAFNKDLTERSYQVVDAGITGMEERYRNSRDKAPTKTPKPLEIVEQPPVEQPPVEQPPVEEPPVVEQPPVDKPPRELDLIWHGNKTKQIEAKKVKLTQSEYDKRKEELEAAKARLEMLKEEERLKQEVAKIQAEDAAEREKGIPLTAINIDMLGDKEELARNLAKEDLDAELKKDNLIKRIWKGKLFREDYEAKYAEEYLDNKRTRDGKTINNIIESDEIIQEKLQGIAKKILSSTTNEMRNAEKEGLAGQRIVAADEKTNSEIKKTIEDYAYALYLTNVSPNELKKDSEFAKSFDSDIYSICENAIEEGRMNDHVDYTNYLGLVKKIAGRYQEIAKNVKDKAEFEEAIARVTEGFRVYTVELMDVIPSDYKSPFQKLMDMIKSGKRDFELPESGNIDEAESEEAEPEEVEPDEAEELTDDEPVDDEPDDEPDDELDDIGELNSVDEIEELTPEAVNEIADEINGAPAEGLEQNKIIEMINKAKDLIGEEGIDIILGRAGETDDQLDRTRNWWNGLSGAGRKAAKDIAKEIYNAPETLPVRPSYLALAFIRTH